MRALASDTGGTLNISDGIPDSLASSSCCTSGPCGVKIVGFGLAGSVRNWSVSASETSDPRPRALIRENNRLAVDSRRVAGVRSVAATEVDCCFRRRPPELDLDMKLGAVGVTLSQCSRAFRRAGIVTASVFAQNAVKLNSHLASGSRVRRRLTDIRCQTPHRFLTASDILNWTSPQDCFLCSTASVISIIRSFDILHV